MDTTEAADAGTTPADAAPAGTPEAASTAPSGSGAAESAASSSPALPDRTGRQAWPYAASAIAYLVVPFILGAALPAPATTTALLVLLPAAALLLGLADGLVFRRTWAFPLLTGVLCFIGLQIYTNSGTWIYAVGVVLLCRLGNRLGGLRHRHRTGA